MALALVGSLFYTSSPTTFAATLDQLSKQRTELEKAIKQQEQNAKAAAEKAKKEDEKQKAFEAEKRRLEGDINATTDRISSTENDIKTIQESIVAQQQKIQQKETDINTKLDEVYETAVAYHMTREEEGNGIFALISSDRLGAAVDRSTDLDYLSGQLTNQADILYEERQGLKDEKARLEADEQNLNKKKNELAAYNRALDTQKNQKVALIDQSQKAESQFTSESQEAKAAAEKLKKQFAAVANEEAAMRRAASKSSKASALRNGDVSKLGFVWPADGTITTYFGGRTPFQNFHTGLDIANSAGTPIVATSSGTVTVATIMCCDASGNSYGYGNWIEIKHDNGFVSRYAHLMEFLVSPGARVERGQVIAYMGGGRGMRGAGWSTGPHLHFEVWDAQGPFDPLDVLPQ